MQLIQVFPEVHWLLLLLLLKLSDSSCEGKQVLVPAQMLRYYVYVLCRRRSDTGTSTLSAGPSNYWNNNNKNKVMIVVFVVLAWQTLLILTDVFLM